MVLAIPGAVAGAYVTVLMALTFVRGMTEIVQGGIDHRKGLGGRGRVLGRHGLPERHDIPRDSFRASQGACCRTASRPAVW